jgi:signal transduction histidine kinase
MLGLLVQPGMVCVPVRNASGPLAVLILGIDEAHGHMTPERMATLQRFASRASGSLATGEPVTAVATGEQSLPGKIRQFVHEARNPLTALKNYVQVLALKYPDAQWTREDLPVISEDIDRAGAILSRLAALESQAPALEADHADVKAIITDLVRIQRRAMLEPRGIKTDLKLDENIPPLKLESNAFKQILNNLIINAGEALEEGGELTIATRDQITDDSGVYVEVVVADNGPGLPAAVIKKLYQPVASKKAGSHAGLGLSIVKDLLDDMGGGIKCQSEAGIGTTFRISLPRSM